MSLGYDITLYATSGTHLDPDNEGTTTLWSLHSVCLHSAIEVNGASCSSPQGR